MTSNHSGQDLSRNELFLKGKSRWVDHIGEGGDGKTG